MDKNVMVIKLNDEHLSNIKDIDNMEEIKECARKHWKLSENRRNNEIDNVEYVIVMHKQKAIAEFKYKKWNLSDPDHYDGKFNRYNLELENSNQLGLKDAKFDYPVSYPVTIISLKELKSKKLTNK